MLVELVLVVFVVSSSLFVVDRVVVAVADGVIVADFIVLIADSPVLVVVLDELKVFVVNRLVIAVV